MSLSKINTILEGVCERSAPNLGDLVFLLSLNGDEQAPLFDFADKIRKNFVGDGVLLRGIVEFSNFCRNTCSYCGLNVNNKKLTRYRLSSEEILESVKIISECGIKTVVLQSGEEDVYPAVWLGELIKEIKLKFDIAVTLSVGERLEKDYALWRKSGADRYLLKIETSDKALYESLHPGMSFNNRLGCLDRLKGLGYQTGCGNIIGLKGQDLTRLAEDIIFFKKHDFEMIGIGPFIPHQETGLRGELKGDPKLALKVLALTRIITKNTHLPATTALGSQEKDFRADALKSGANVLMPNFTPLKYKALYEIYPGKKCITEDGSSCLGCLEANILPKGRYLDFSRGDSLKYKERIATNV